MGIAAFLFFLLSFVFFLSCFRYLFIPLFIFLYDKGLIFYAYRNGFVFNETGNKEILFIIFPHSRCQCVKYMYPCYSQRFSDSV